jgi:hypothetical protein
MNAAPTDDPLWPVVRPQYRLNLAQQSAFLVQASALALAAGVERMAVYKFYDWSLPPHGEAFGLLRADGSRRPAFDTWKLVIQVFSGVESAALAQSDALDVVRLRRDDEQQVIVAWARTAEAARLRVSAAAADAVLFDQYGGAQVIQPEAGYYTLALDGARCNRTDGCAVGGNAILLVQSSGNVTVEDITGVVIPLVFQGQTPGD